MDHKDEQFKTFGENEVKKMNCGIQAVKEKRENGIVKGYKFRD